MKKEPLTPPPGVHATSQSPHQQPGSRGEGNHISWNAPGAGGAGPSSNTRENLASNNPYRTNTAHPNLNQGGLRSSASPSVTADYEPPPGPPPGWAPVKDEPMEDVETFEPPPGPPPGYTPTPQSQPQYAPPAGPPPSRGGIKRKERSQEPPDYDPWHGGPNDELRLPPSFAAINPQNMKSPTANASWDDAKRAHDWCRAVKLFKPTDHTPIHLQRIHTGDLALTVPPNTGDITVYQPAVGKTYIRTFTTIHDTILLSDLPVFASQHQSPMVTGRPETIYFELHLISIGDRYNAAREVESGIAIGFVAPPYPSWRLPGWHRASLGVHGDDGRRYVDNSYGGIDFTNPFKKGDVVGIGMTFKPPIHGDRVATRADVFFTRNGRREGGWDLHEERDRDTEEGDVTGLEGEHDLLAAVGIFGMVSFFPQ